MIEIAVASGKGGTGKTFLASNLLYYMYTHGIPAAGLDADVEEPDLAISLGGRARCLEEFVCRGARVARIDHSKCIACRTCVDVCRFRAIRIENSTPVVDEDECSGCGLCEILCPSKAIDMVETELGNIRRVITGSGIEIVEAELIRGGSSGKLVYEAKTYARTVYRDRKALVVDVAAGIGCPVISAIAGADLLVVVVEPMPQSMQGAERLIEMARAMSIRCVAVVNRFDLYGSKPREIANVEVIGYIPFDPRVVESYYRMKPILAYAPTSSASRALIEVIEHIIEIAKIR